MFWIIGAVMVLFWAWVVFGPRPLEKVQVQRLGPCYLVRLDYYDGTTEQYIGEDGDWYEYPDGHWCTVGKRRELDQVVARNYEEV